MRLVAGWGSELTFRGDFEQQYLLRALLPPPRNLERFLSGPTSPLLSATLRPRVDMLRPDQYHREPWHLVITANRIFSQLIREGLVSPELAFRYMLTRRSSLHRRYAVNSTLPISKTYAAGRSVAALTCGPNFAPLISKTTVGAASVSHAVPRMLLLFLLSLTMFLYH